jgi:MinD-like ATPase involved in chromosome partitioning or flagellar assembly
MNYRGFDRGVQFPRRGARQNQLPQHQPLPRPPLPASAPDASGDRQPPWPARATTGTTTVPAGQVKTPPGSWHRPKHRIALDSLEVPHADAPPEFSWRSVLSQLTGIHLGPSKGEIYELGLRDRVRAQLGGAFPIAVLNLKGGVGKTSVVEALGSTFAEARSDRVIAVDVDAGDLADRHGYRNQLSLVDLLADRSVTRYPDVRAYTCRNRAGLELLALPNYADGDWLIDRDDVLRVFSILRNHYSVVLMDCGKSLKSAVAEAVLLESRALVIVTNASIDAIEKTHTTLEWLARNGWRRQIQSMVLAINHTERARPSGPVDDRLQRLSNQFPPNRVVVLPFDRHVREGNEIALERLGKHSKRGYLEMAAALAGMFPRRNIGTSAHLSR